MKTGQKIWVEVTDWAGQLAVHGEYFKKKPTSRMYKYKEARIILLDNKE